MKVSNYFCISFIKFRSFEIAVGRYILPYRLTVQSSPAIYAWLWWNFTFDKRCM